MENKIVLELIKKDIDELKLLVESIQKSSNSSHLLIEIASAKAKTLLQEFELLKAGNNSEPTNNETIELSAEQKEEVNEVIEEVRPIIVQEEIAESILIKEEQIIEEKIQIEPIIEEKIEDKTSVEVILENEPETKTVEIHEEDAQAEQALEEPELINNEPEVLVENEQPIIESEVSIEPKPEPVQQIETTPEPEKNNKKIFGEQFIKEPSLHDRLSAEKQVESKIKGKPVTNLKAAIGLNDKFMYTRELFGNNHDNFNHAISSIDNCSELIEAIEYLEQNYTWSKNDVSVKFMELVKRRFDN